MKFNKQKTKFTEIIEKLQIIHPPLCPITKSNYNITKHNMVFVYKILKMYNEVQLTKQ